MIANSHSMNLLAAPLALACMMHAQVAAQNPGLELIEVKTALESSNQRIAVLEEQLRQQKTQAETYADSLATANAELQQTRDAYNQLRMQMEGLGVAAIDSTGSQLEQKLLTALSDLRIVEQQKRALADALIGLSESVIANSNGQNDPVARENLEQRLADAEKALAYLRVDPEQQNNGTLQNASIVSLKEELGIAVLNVGSKQGVLPGMPFSIYRQDKPIARALIVDVRGAVSGAIVQELIDPNDRVRIGDVGKVETDFKG